MWFLLLVALPLVFCSGPEVDTNYGRVRGFYYNLPNTQQARVFLGVPFAKPPVGSLRFEKPQPPDNWSGTLNTTAFGHRCHPNPYYSVNNDEDCLTLNIVAPPDTTPVNPYPVVLWIHGGGYELGSTDIIGYNIYATKYAAEGVIVVAVQYRIGFLGFLSTGDARLPGNYGLWDNAVAIDFVRENIGAFGGDPNKITIYGQSAGGTSVSLLSVAPYTRNKIARSIAMSGVAWSSWALNPRGVNYSLSIISNIGCPNDANVKACLQNKPIDEFRAAVNASGPMPYHLSMLRIGPRVDGDLIPARPDVLVKQFTPKPTIIGVCSLESVLFTTMHSSTVLGQYNIYDNEFTSFNETRLKQFFSDIIATPEFFGNKSAQIQQVLEKRYLVDLKPAGANYTYFLHTYTQTITELHFFVSSLRGAQQTRARGGKVYLYRFDYYPPHIFTNSSPERGAPHSADANFVNDLATLGAYNWTQNDYDMQNATLGFILQFAKTGNPSTPLRSWPAIKGFGPAQYKFLRFAPPLPELQKGLFVDAFKFWNRVSDCGKVDLVEFAVNPNDILQAVRCNLFLQSYLG